MKLLIIGGGNMGGAIAQGLTLGTVIQAKDITVVDPGQKQLDALKAFNPDINCVSILPENIIRETDIIMFAVKPWLIQSVIDDIKFKLDYKKQLIISIAAGISFDQLTTYLKKDQIDTAPALYRVVPNTAIAVRQSITFVSSINATDEQDIIVLKMFEELGSAMLIQESQIPAATSLASCGIAYAMRYVRAAMEGGVELGFYPDVAKNIVLQTIKGAVELLQTNNTHPEVEIDKVTTAGGITIQGLNEMEHAGFTSAVIKGLKKSANK